jgi:hypothetical protein
VRALHRTRRRGTRTQFVRGVLEIKVHAGEARVDVGCGFAHPRFDQRHGVLRDELVGFAVAQAGGISRVIGGRGQQQPCEMEGAGWTGESELTSFRWMELMVCVAFVGVSWLTWCRA